MGHWSDRAGYTGSSLFSREAGRKPMDCKELGVIAWKDEFNVNPAGKVVDDWGFRLTKTLPNC